MLHVPGNMPSGVVFRDNVHNWRGGTPSCWNRLPGLTWCARIVENVTTSEMRVLVNLQHQLPNCLSFEEVNFW